MKLNGSPEDMHTHAFKLRKNNPIGIAINIAADMIDEAADEISRLTKWQEAVIDELIVCGIFNKHHEDPRVAINDIINWNVSVAIDPLVSSDARNLITRGLEEARDMFMVNSVSWNLLNDKILATAEEINIGDDFDCRNNRNTEQDQ